MKEVCFVLEISSCLGNLRNFQRSLLIGISECKAMTNIIAEHRQEDAGQTDKIRLINLRSLTLEFLPSLVSLSPESGIKATKDGNGFSSQLFNDKVEFPNLETLKLYSINIQKIWNDQLSYVQNLTSLTVDGCERMTYLFSYSVATKLVKLEHLLISSCKFVEQIFMSDENLGNLILSRKSAPTEQVPIFPNLDTFVISDMDNLKSIWPDKLTPKSFCKLKKMEITSCNNLLLVFPCHVLDKLQSLESLNLWYCVALEVVYEIDGINIDGFCTGNHNLRFPWLNKLYVVQCPALETFSRGILRASILRKIYLTGEGDQSYWEGDLNTTK